ncbi:MAG: hypothetical protein ACFCU6_02010, partial [Balneolaceae bacterium]
ISLYPVSQIFQTEEDTGRGDRTFAVKYGVEGVKKFFKIAFLTGLVLTTGSLYNIYVIPSILFGSVGFLAWIFLIYRINKLTGKREEYQEVMKIKWIASLSFVIFLMISILIRYNMTGITISKEIFK